MKDNIFAKKEDVSKEIFKDKDIFYSDFVPEEVLCRETQTSTLKYSLEPLIKGQKASNVLIYGPPGTGKTLLSKFVLNHLIEYSHKVKYKYINCIQENTRFAIFSKILQLFSAPLPRRGLAIDEIIDRLKEYLSKSSFTPIIIIDEIDQLNNKEASNILYDLSRISKNSKYFTLILITNNKDFILDLEPRTKSSLFLDNIEFKTYSSSELKLILNQRVDYGLLKDVISQDLISFISGFAASRGGDARIGIELLFKSAKECERTGKNKIDKATVIKCSKQVDEVKLKTSFDYLNDSQKEILKILEDGMKTDQIYSKIKKSPRTIRRYLTHLEKLNLIRFKEIYSNKGRSRKIFLNFNKDLLNNS